MSTENSCSKIKKFKKAKTWIFVKYILFLIVCLEIIMRQHLKTNGKNQSRSREIRCSNVVRFEKQISRLQKTNRNESMSVYLNRLTTLKLVLDDVLTNQVSNPDFI